MATFTVDVPDDVIAREGLTDATIRVEVACRLFDAEKLSKGEACRLAGMTRDEFNEALMLRGLPVIRYTEEMWAEDLASLEKMREQSVRTGGHS